uniref:NAC family transcription factor n=1 Tax=Melilotus albus TaxID=47082 RepID=A0A896W5D6_MELAB|nr:NAC family transcription factor [Melilotus albus]
MALNSSSSKEFIFKLTDHELLRFLYNKIHNNSLPNYITILEYDLFGTLKNPWEIWEEFGTSNSNCEKDLYFFTTLKKKSATSSCFVRTIGIGTWEGEDTGKNIVAKDKNKLLGVKKYFRFEKSNTNHDGEWILHEYSLDKSLITNPSAKNYVLCRFIKNCIPLPRKNTRTKNIVAQDDKERKTIVPGCSATTISGNNTLLTEYIIYEEPRNESNGNTESHNKEEEKNVTNIWPKETVILGPEAANKFAEEDGNQPDDSNNEAEEDGDLIMSKEKDGDVIMNKEENGDASMSWPELFSRQLMDANEGCLIKEEDVKMISNEFYKDLLLENIDINK